MQLFFDDRFLAKHGTKEEARKQLKATMAHAQVYFCHDSLGSKIELKVTLTDLYFCPKFNFKTFQRQGKEFVHFENEEWRGNYGTLPRIQELTKENLGTADIAIFFGHEPKDASFGGIASLGTICQPNPWYNQHKLSFDLWWYNPSITARIVAHELGHNIGMSHDDYPPHVDAGCDKTGIMSNTGCNAGPGKCHLWSACSRADFEAQYLKFEDKWCMEENENACQTV